MTVNEDAQEDAARCCHGAAAAEGLLVVSPFDDPDVIAGQGTAGWWSIAGRASCRGSACAQSMAASVRAGRPADAPEALTWADSLLGGVGGDNPFTLVLVRDGVGDRVEVSEEGIVEALSFCWSTTA